MPGPTGHLLPYRIAKMSDCFTMRYFLPSTVTSVPAYLPYRTVSPALTSMGSSRANGDNHALLRFFLGIVRDVKAPGGHGLGLFGLNDHSCS